MYTCIYIVCTHVYALYVQLLYTVCVCVRACMIIIMLISFIIIIALSAYQHCAMFDHASSTDTAFLYGVGLIYFALTKYDW